LGADGLLKFATAQNAAGGARDRPAPIQRPLMIRDAREADDEMDDMEEDDHADIA
jgi:hypothetical protein